jgi:hypothetical protein
MPPGPVVLCEIWPEGLSCPQSASCGACHTTPPARDAFGQQLEEALWPGEQRPESNQGFEDGIRSVINDFADIDSDNDGFSNRIEWEIGTDPGDANSVPEEVPEDDPCSLGSGNPDFNLCAYDYDYAFKRASLDVCGRSPRWEDYTSFKELGAEDKRARIHNLVNECLQGSFWLGSQGVLWRLAHAKIKPLSSLKSGNNPGAIPLGDYEPDYALFSYVMSGDRDVRDLLLANYYVELSSEDPPTYQRVNQLMGQNLEANRRNGMITSRWFLLINTMFTPVPRTTAAQAYRSYLGLDIAKSEGLIVPNEFETLTDYDDKGITEPACAACHTTLDPLSYPFSRFNGIRGPQTGSYQALRLRSFGPEEGENLRDLPEQGAILGQTVADLSEWAEVAANSDEFVQKVTKDLWKYFIGHEPKSEVERSEFEEHWVALKTIHNYRVEALVHQMIDSLSYGRP